MKKKNNIEIEHFCLVFVILGVVFLAFKILRSDYRTYHAEMHGAPVWGRIIRVDAPTIGKNGNIHDCEVEYSIGNDSFLIYTGELPKRYLNDSLIVIYDTTDVRRSFVLLRNPKDAKTAFFKSQKDYMPLRWQQDYDKRLLELEKKRVAHRERKHFYDRFCRDD
ncbi:MAG: hypothetical protein IKW82_11050 [Bacteroidales bacterium]|nr:hypothetical protein [Bacteroidales bacterium]